MSAEDYPHFLPPWGVLSVEQYLIRSWDHSSTETINQQRERLVQQFIQLDEIPEEWEPPEFPNDPELKLERAPTSEAVARILRPWRSDDMRKRAWNIWCGENMLAPVMLRTYYGNPENGDEKMYEYAHASGFYSGGAHWSVLNNAELFNFGSDWRRAFSILPEIAGCRSEQRQGLDQGQLNRDYARLGDSIDEAKRAHPQWKQDVNVLLEENSCARSLLREVSIAWILIMDKEAFETDRMLVVYLDGKQNVTVQGRVDITQDMLDELMIAWEDGCIPGPVFEEGTIGDKYRLDRESGKRFFRLVDSDLEQEVD